MASSSDIQGSSNTILLPEHSPSSVEEIDQALRGFGITDAVVFQTSGSSGDARLVVHSRVGLEASAEAVNAHLEAGAADVWLRALPDFHVGGYGVNARAEASKSDVYALDGRWDADRLVAVCEENGVTLTSLVPTQVFDLVERGLRCPQSLRAVLVGGGHLEATLEAQARALGWPVLRTYGLSEAGSQVATQRGDELLVLSHLQVSIASDQRLKLRGKSMALGYLYLKQDGQWEFDELLGEDGWFPTDDIVELEGDVLRFVSRASARVKVLGELVDVEALERAFIAKTGSTVDAAILAVEDSRAEHLLWLVIHKTVNLESISSAVEAFNTSVAGFERISRVVQVDEIPRSELGKVRRGTLREQVLNAEK